MDTSKGKKSFIFVFVLALLLVATSFIPMGKVKAATSMVSRLSGSGAKVTDGANVSYEAQQTIQDGSGGYIVAWRSPNVDTWGNDEVFAQKINGNGVKQWGTNGVNVSNEPTATQSDVRIATDGAGGAFIFWIDLRNFVIGVNGYEIYGQRIDGSGATQWASGGIQFFAPVDGVNVWLHDIVEDGAGNVYLSYYYKGQGFLKKIASDGSVTWTDMLYDLGTNQFYHKIALSRDISNGVFATWNQSGQMIQKVLSDGTMSWTTSTTQVSDTKPPYSGGYVYSIKGDGSGGVFSAWGYSATSSLDKTYVQHLDSTNAKLWGADGAQILSGLTISGPSEVILDGAGGIFVSGIEDSAGTSVGVIDRIDSTGASLWGASGIQLSSAGGESTPEADTLIPDGTGGVIVTWRDSRYSNDLYDGSSTYVQQYNNAGVAQWETNGLAFSMAGTAYPKTFTNAYSGIDISWVDMSWENSGLLFQSLTPGSGHYITTTNPIDPTDLNFNSVKPGSNYSLSQPDEKVKLLDTANSSILTDVIVDMTADRDWTTVAGESDLVNNKSVIANLNSAPGAAATHALYIPKGTNDDHVRICPNAANLTDVTTTCTSGYELTTSDVNVRVVTIWGREYWRIDQLTGTGGQSSPYNTYGANEITVAGNVDATDAAGSSVAVGSGNGLDGLNNLVRTLDINTSIYFGQANVDMTSARDWSSVAGESDSTNGKSYVSSLNTAPGADATFKLLVPKVGSPTGVYLCPGATSLTDVTDTCTGGYKKLTGDADLASQTISGQAYWVVSGLSNAAIGGMNYDVANLTLTASTGYITIGDAINVTVTAKNSLNQTVAYYSGIIHFTSTDGGITLPGNYTFVAGDNGVHVFNSLVFSQTGTFTITATDTVTGTITGTTGDVVVSNPVASYTVTPSSNSFPLGDAIDITVTAKDALNNTLTTYTGIIHFTSTDSGATLPADYTFVLGDGGVHTFNNVLLSQAGSFTISVNDTATGLITETTGTITVNNTTPVLGGFTIVPASTSIRKGQAMNVTVTAKDTLNNTMTTYVGTVHFSSTNSNATLPSDYTFTGGNLGVNTFTVTFNQEGSFTVSVRDTVSQNINATTPAIQVNPENTSGGIPSRAGTNDNITQEEVIPSYPVTSGLGMPGSFPQNPNLPTTGGSTSTDQSVKDTDRINNSMNILTSLSNLSLPIVLAATAGIIGSFLASSTGEFTNIFGVFLGFLIPKKRKYWGFIIDSTSNEPVPFATVNLYNQTNTSQIIETAISDMHGRYRMNVASNSNFIIQVKASGYNDYKKELGSQIKLIVGDMVVEDILIDRVNSKFNLVKRIFFYSKIKLLNIFVVITSILTFAGLGANLLLVISAPGLINVILFAIYALLSTYIIYRIIKIQRFGRGEVIDELSGFKLKGVSVRMYDLNKKLLEVGITNDQGIIRFDLPAGKYYLLATKAGYGMVEYNEGFLKQVTLTEEGLISERIKLKRTEHALNSGLESPFN